MVEMKANDIICVDIQKTRIENDLDNLYGNIILELENILDILGLDKSIIDNKLNSGILSQTKFDHQLMRLIEIIKYESESDL